jgi:hypothetical protein
MMAFVLLRRVVIVFAVVLLVSAVLGSLAPDPRQAQRPDRSTLPSPAPGGAGVVRGELPADEVVEARVGDRIELTVTAAEPDSVSIEELGLTGAVAAEAPARFDVLADRAGEFEVRLALSDTLAGTIEVREPKAGDGAPPGA